MRYTHFPLPRSLQRILPTLRPYVTFRNKFFFYGEELLSPRQTPELENRPLLAVRDCLFNILAAVLYIWRPLLQPQPENASCRGDGPPNVAHFTVNTQNVKSQLYTLIEYNVPGILPGYLLNTTLYR
jgi:hypothetical protein